MVNLSLRKNSKKNAIVVFDFSSSSLGGILFFFDKKKSQPEILACLRQPLKFSFKERGFPILWKDVHQAFFSICSLFKKVFSGKIEQVFFVFSSPWYVSQTKIIKVERQSPFEIDEKFVKSLTENESKIFKESWRGSFGKIKSDLVFIEKEPIKFILNGYEVNSAVKKRAKKLELFVYFSLGLEYLENKIRQEIANNLYTSSVVFQTFPFVLYKVLRNIMNAYEGFVVGDITGEITDIFVIRDNIIEEMSSFNKGENFLIRRVASAFNIEFEEAKYLVSQYQRGELKYSLAEKTGKILKISSQEWHKMLKKLLLELSKDRLLPPNFYFLSNSSLFKEIIGLMKKEEFADYVVLQRPFKINQLLPNSLKHYFLFSRNLSGLSNKDIFLLIASLFVAKIYYKNYE